MFIFLSLVKHGTKHLKNSVHLALNIQKDSWNFMNLHQFFDSWNFASNWMASKKELTFQNIVFSWHNFKETQ
jgi:hypothetical protein